MKKLINSLCLSLSSLITIPTTILAQDVPKLNIPGCDHVSYMITETGKCLDLSHFSGTQVPPVSSSLVSRFELALQRINVPIKYSDPECVGQPNSITFGFYQSNDNVLVICPAALENKQIFEETLIHESWHTVQDCLAGLDNPKVIALSEVYPEMFQNILGATSLKDFNDVISLYDARQHKAELEARYMEDKPDLVLEGLNRCAK
ncbi:MAG: hypothetical protein AB4062_09390 [Crocosphaera sp.]